MYTGYQNHFNRYTNGLTFLHLSTNCHFLTSQSSVTSLLLQFETMCTSFASSTEKNGLLSDDEEIGYGFTNVTSYERNDLFSSFIFLQIKLFITTVAMSYLLAIYETMFYLIYVLFHSIIYSHSLTQNILTMYIRFISKLRFKQYARKINWQ